VPAISVKEPVPVYGSVPPVEETVTVEDPPMQAITVFEADATRVAG
jgi:hypothetical protein